MLDEINAALKEYYARWHSLVDSRKDSAYFKQLKPTAVGWKVADLAAYDAARAQLRPQAGIIHERRMSSRWLASVVLDDVELEGGVAVIELIQCLPGSGDALGLDHVDFYTPDIARLDNVMQQESDLKANQETDEAIDDSGWLSIWFEGTEAKIKSRSVLHLAAKELQALDDMIVDSGR